MTLANAIAQVFENSMECHVPHEMSTTQSISKMHPHPPKRLAVKTNRNIENMQHKQFSRQDQPSGN